MNVIFVAVQNARRSEIAEALVRRTAAGAHDARSADSDPAARVRPEVVEAMHEFGINLPSGVPRQLDADVERVDVVVRMGRGDACPSIPDKRYLDWEPEDPAGRELAATSAIRDEVAVRIEELLADLDGEPST